MGKLVASTGHPRPPELRGRAPTPSPTRSRRGAARSIVGASRSAADSPMGRCRSTRGTPEEQQARVAANRRGPSDDRFRPHRRRRPPRSRSGVTPAPARGADRAGAPSTALSAEIYACCPAIDQGRHERLSADLLDLDASHHRRHRRATRRGDLSHRTGRTSAMRRRASGRWRWTRLLRSAISFADARAPSNLLGRRGERLKNFLHILDGGPFGCRQRWAVGRRPGQPLDEAITYAKGRRAFGKPIAGYQAIQAKIADLSAQIEAARSLTHRPRSRRIPGSRSGSPRPGGADHRAARCAVAIRGGARLHDPGD